MLTIRCAHCHKKLLKYQKIGDGRLINCWKERIKQNYTLQNEGNIICPCGKLIGRDLGNAIKLRQSSIIISGKTIK